jgi:hypothetical protein
MLCEEVDDLDWVLAIVADPGAAIHNDTTKDIGVC